MKKIVLTKDDEELAAKAKTAMSEAINKANMPAAVAKSIFVAAARHRNKGRKSAMRRHPFKGICEVSGKPLKSKDKVLDEMEPEKGYAGKVRWVCPQHNNSGTQSCG